jgi:hypothetical protein
MSVRIREIEQLAAQLDPQDLQELKDIVEFLVARKNARNSCPIKQSWAGALSHLKDQYTSLELQKKALGWRGD